MKLGVITSCRLVRFLMALMTFMKGYGVLKAYRNIAAQTKKSGFSPPFEMCAANSARRPIRCPGS